MNERYAHRLSAGANNLVVALSESEVGKLFSNDTRSDIGSEAEKMKFANAINSLVVRFIRLDIHRESASEMLVMERLYAIDFRSQEVEKRELWLDVFRDELEELHRQGFVHRDLRRPSDLQGQLFDNILLTAQGLRLIDVGISAIRSQVGDVLFEKFVGHERKELDEFAEYLIAR